MDLDVFSLTVCRKCQGYPSENRNLKIAKEAAGIRNVLVIQSVLTQKDAPPQIREDQGP